MMLYEKMRPPRCRSGMFAGMAAAVLAAALLAGCGGGGGGGGGGSSSGGGGGSAPQVIASKFVRADQAGDNNLNATVTIGTASGANPTPEVDVLPNAAPVGGVTVTIQTDPTPPVVPTSLLTLSSQIYDIQPSGTTFRSSGINIKIPYNSTVSSTNVGFLLMYYYDSTLGSWQLIPSQQVDTTNHVVVASVTQIVAGRTGGQADYAIFLPALPPPPAPAGG